jgi:cell pole-organizing protein PopZ
MSDAKSPQNLSMDEILATIRRIIAEDEQASAATVRAVPVDSPAGGGHGETTQAQAAGSEAADILDLTDALNEDGSVRRLAPSWTTSRASEPAASSRDPSPAAPLPGEPTIAVPRSAGTRPEAEHAADPPSPSPASSPDGTDERLLSDVAALAAATAFGRLAAAPRARREPPLVGGRPLDDIVRDLLRPLLQTWLDENLPGIVERLVAAEIARIRAGSGPD